MIDILSDRSGRWSAQVRISAEDRARRDRLRVVYRRPDSGGTAGPPRHRAGREQRLRHSNLTVILRSCRLRTVGENVAVGYPSGRSVVRGWVGSSGHRANIVNTAFRGIGLGAVQDRSGRWWVAQVLGR